MHTGILEGNSLGNMDLWFSLHSQFPLLSLLLFHTLGERKKKATFGKPSYTFCKAIQWAKVSKFIRTLSLQSWAGQELYSSCRKRPFPVMHTEDKGYKDPGMSAGLCRTRTHCKVYLCYFTKDSFANKNINTSSLQYYTRTSSLRIQPVRTEMDNKLN